MRMILRLLVLVALIGLPVAPAFGEVPFIDTHVHMHSPRTNIPCSYADAIKQALAKMDAFGVQMSLVMPTPPAPDPQDLQKPQDPQQNPCADYGGLAEVAGHSSGRFAFLGGGRSLDVMILDAVSGVAIDEDDFTGTANHILRSGGIGYGETVAQHFSLREGHPYWSAPPDHPLFLLLADIAATIRVSIDLHMEAGPESECTTILPDGRCGIPLPSELRDSEGKPLRTNPEFFPANIAALERLLSHSPNARIVWAHAGWDNTGYRTLDLMRRLLEDHPNLYMNIKMAGGSILQRPNLSRPLDGNGNLRPKWLDLIRSFPDRFTIGTDVKYLTDLPERIEGDLRRARSLLNQLPADLALKVGLINPACIYDLGPARACIDIKPGSYPNSINLGSGGTVPVAILSSGSFDATTVNPLTVTLADAPVKLKGKGAPMASFEDVNGDGLLDLVVHVSTEVLQLNETDTIAILEGQTFAGVLIRGRDTVRIVP